MYYVYRAKNKTNNALIFVAILILFQLLWLKSANAAEATNHLSEKDMVLAGDASCTKCHDEDQEYPILHIAKTRHGNVADKRAPGCKSCHGQSTEHAQSKSDDDRPKPDITYRDLRSSVPVEERVENDMGFMLTEVAARNNACLSCHQGGDRMFWFSNTHANRDISCTSCHQIHTEFDRVRDKQVQTEICFSCHKDQRTALHKPSHHPVLEGKMGCSDCHNPHGSAGRNQLKRDSVNETCYSCHMEKRGPFVHNHQPVTEDCSLCHNPHGSNIANLLKTRPPLLCYQCHSDSDHRAQLPGIPSARTASSSQLGMVGRGCLNCHTNIHGGNSTQDSATSGRFRR